MIELFLTAVTFICFFHTVSSRLTTIDESASILSDISYDKTDDSLVCHFLED